MGRPQKPSNASAMGTLDMLILARLAQGGPTPEELDRARTTLLTDLARHLQTTSGRAELLGSHEATLGSYQRLADRIEVYRGLGDAEVRKAAAQLGVSYKTLLNKMKECGISAPGDVE